MTIREEFEKAYGEWLSTRKETSCADVMDLAVIWAAKWMAKRCGLLVKERYIGSSTARLQKEIRELAKELE